MVEASELSNSEMLARCAIRLPVGTIVDVDPPLRHSEAVRAARAAGHLDTEIQGSEHGFITSTGRFVNRRQAAKLAEATGQRKSTTGPSDWLTIYGNIQNQKSDAASGCSRAIAGFVRQAQLGDLHLSALKPAKTLFPHQQAYL